MLGGMAMKWRWRAKRKALGKPADKPNFVCGPVQVCWHKFARYWDVEIREIPMEPGRLFMDAERMLEAVDENTIGVVPTFGVTYTGNFEYPEPLQDALDKLQKSKGLDIDIHVDAASGGFLAPFCAPEIAWDFRLPRVKSISSSGHKYGLAPLGCGWVVWRDAGVAAGRPRLQGRLPRRPGRHVRHQLLAARRPSHLAILRIPAPGPRGLHEGADGGLRVAQYLAEEIGPLGPYEFICTGEREDGHSRRSASGSRRAPSPDYSLYDVSDRLRMRGWQVPAFLLAGGASDITVMRIMCRRGFEMDMACAARRGLQGGPRVSEQARRARRFPRAEGTGFHHN